MLFGSLNEILGSDQQISLQVRRSEAEIQAAMRLDPNDTQGIDLQDTGGAYIAIRFTA